MLDFFWKPYAGKKLHDLLRPQKKTFIFLRSRGSFGAFLISFPLRPAPYYIPQQTDVPLSWPFFSPPSISCFQGMGEKKMWEKRVSEGRWIIARLHFLAAATHANMPNAKWGGKGGKEDEQHNLAHLSKKERERKLIQNSNFWVRLLKIAM